MIIALDGADGAGKSTHARLLCDWLQERGVACHLVSKWDVLDADRHPDALFLDGTQPSELRACVASMPPTARPLFILWLYAEVAARAARLAQRGVVVLDGYWMKHAAAELAYGSDPRMVEAIVASFDPVDAVVYLDIEPAQALERKRGALTTYECGLDPTLDPGKFLAQQAAIRARLLEWAERDGWIRIEAASADATQQRIRERVLALLRDQPAQAAASGS